MILTWSLALVVGFAVDIDREQHPLRGAVKILVNVKLVFEWKVLPAVHPGHDGVIGVLVRDVPSAAGGPRVAPEGASDHFNVSRPAAIGG